MRDSSIKGIMALMAVIVLISLFPAAVTQEDNAVMNNTALKNVAILNKTNTALATETNRPSVLPDVSSVLQIGKGMRGNTIGMSSLNKDNIAYPTKFQANRESIRPELALGGPAKPMKDLEKVVFICNIM
ncbi:MAG: hypothetical protein ACE14P_05710 [Methanotrichaceae archaeon]